MAGPPTSVRPVAAAIIGNGFVAIIKLLAFSLSGSGAMLSEAIHSLADTGNQLLLYLGIRLSARKRDSDFHYGYGGERFIFGLLSAAGIFFLGCGVTIYHGIQSILEPRMPQFGIVTYLVLALSFVIEGSVLAYAIKVTLKKKGTTKWWTYLRERADPAETAVLLEDSAAILGLILAAAGIVAAQTTGDGTFDAIASLFVGLLLGAIAVFLVFENRALLLGAAAPQEVEDRFLAVLRAWPSIEAVHDVKTRMLTPEAFILKAELKLRVEYVAQKLDAILPQSGLVLEGEPRRASLRVITKAAIEVVGGEVDAIELAVRKAIPEARHIDLELEHLHIPKPETLG